MVFYQRTEEVLTSFASSQDWEKEKTDLDVQEENGNYDGI